MNREIKFRAWDGKEMHHKVNILSNWGAIKEGYFATPYLEDAKAGVLMQYTGLKDKNGKEIYEGDITFHRRHNRKSNIVWVDDYACFCGETIDEVVNGEYNFYQKIDCDTLEIIGNIYENPELLNQKS